MDGGTTFHFITAGFDAAYSAACQAAGDNGVDIAGGASTVRQALIAGVIDELTLSAHTSRAMRGLIAARDWLTVYQLPSYASELNPSSRSGPT
jgi:dihydrofolate reductase